MIKASFENSTRKAKATQSRGLATQSWQPAVNTINFIYARQMRAIRNSREPPTYKNAIGDTFVAWFNCHQDVLMRDHPTPACDPRGLLEAAKLRQTAFDDEEHH